MSAPVIVVKLSELVSHPALFERPTPNSKVALVTFFHEIERLDGCPQRCLANTNRCLPQLSSTWAAKSTAVGIRLAVFRSRPSRPQPQAGRGVAVRSAALRHLLSAGSTLATRTEHRSFMTSSLLSMSLRTPGDLRVMRAGFVIAARLARKPCGHGVNSPPLSGLHPTA